MATENDVSPSRASSQAAEAQSSQSHSSDGEDRDYSFSFQAGSSEGSANSEGKSSQDKFAHTRGKRKRTSPADQAILEAEYQRNSRPDKATRSALVSRVALSDKEVQIWFQNRRQMSRRRCRTWQPNEITSIIRSSQEGKIEDPNPEPSDMSTLHSSSQPPEAVASCDPETVSSSIASTNQTQATEDHGTRPLTAKSDISAGINFIRSIGSTNDSFESVKGDASFSASTHDRADIDAAAQSSAKSFNRQRAASASTQHDTETRVNSTYQAVQPNPISNAPYLRRKSSSIRLSTSLEGKAQVVMGGGTPSPPKKRSGPLQRSQSLFSPSSQPPSSADGSTTWQRPRAHGRSKDARTWEFYCDSDARNSLTKAAELDQKGSALGVIGLIRSGSGGRNPLAPIRKENTQLKRKGLSDHSDQKPKLARTASSVARLQTATYKKEAQPNPGKEVEIWQDPEGDSDKENIEPSMVGSRRPAHDIRPTPSARRDALQENTSIISHSTSLGAMMDKDPTLSARRKRQLASQDKENRPGTAVSLDEEVSAFMDGSAPGRAEDEMDAVQNLLSLSQGEWR